MIIKGIVMGEMRLLVMFPGVGYHCDKPLLYYGRKIAREAGYEECVQVSYSAPVDKIRGDEEKMKKTFESMYQQTEEQLQDIKWDEYDDVLFMSKSIGTIIAASYARKHDLSNVRQVLYTPLADTMKVLGAVDVSEVIEVTDTKDFSDTDKNTNCKELFASIAFIGTNDPWSDITEVIDLASKIAIKLFIYGNADHSLETGDIISDLDTIKDVMEKTKTFIMGKDIEK
jgi:phosphoglycolate phosphatase